MNAASEPIVMPGYAPERLLLPGVIPCPGGQSEISVFPVFYLTDLLAAGCGARPFGLQNLN